MITLTMDGRTVSAERGETLLAVARRYGVEVPTLCDLEGLTPFGGCRLCLVELRENGRTRLTSSCTHPAAAGQEVRTDTARVLTARKLTLELLLAQVPSSKKLQDMASEMGLTRVRFKPRNGNCILCGLCVRICEEQMGGKAIGFSGRGLARRVTSPFRRPTNECKNCGACLWACPVCENRCMGTQEGALCGRCLNAAPTWAYLAGALSEKRA
jgi:NADH dehydrogenase/NADH:ubiquinone oxidoreductase subunit G